MQDTVDVEVRPATSADLPQLAEFIDPFVKQGWLLKRTMDELEQLLPHAFVATSEGQVVGCAALEIYSKKLAEVRSLAVDPDYRRHGIGKQLVEACVARARERDVLEVMAITATEAFFQSCGFDFTLPGQKKALFLQTRETP